MKNKGFTLVELLGVLIVLGVLAAIITPTVAGTLKKSREKAYEKQISTLENAAKKWGTENVDQLPDIGSSKTVAVSFNTLYTTGQIQNEKIIDPRTKESLKGCILVSYNNDYNQYEYNYSDDEKQCNPLCQVVSGDGKTPGDEVSCRVNDMSSYIFYVLSTEGDNVNLITKESIGSSSWIGCYDGAGYTEEEIYGAGLDYGSSSSYGDCSYDTDYYSGAIARGPITAMRLINNTTKDWINMPNVNIQYDNELTSGSYGDVYQGMYTTGDVTSIKGSDGTVTASYTNLKARLPRISESIFIIPSISYYGITTRYNDIFFDGTFASDDVNSYYFPLEIHPVVTISKSDIK